jgi:Zn-dependent peptidase ImmA (M78 family)
MKKLNDDIKQYIIQITEGLYKDYQLQIEKLCKKLNIKCYVADFEGNISGSIIRDENDGTYTIYMNRKHSKSRQRFTAAHEIGHYISYLHNSYSKEELEKEGGFEDYAVSYRKQGHFSDAETEANLIAAELLMPEDKVEELLKEGLTPEEIADQFYVSPSAMTVRLQSLYKNLSYMI